MKILFLFVTLSAFHAVAYSQRLTADTAASPSFKAAVAFYNSSFSSQHHLYNGKEYRDPKSFNVGQPYFLTDTFSRGRVNYEGYTYEDVPMLYDLTTDELVILHFNDIYRIQLIKEKVLAFSLSGHSFINLGFDTLLAAQIKPGFYDVLAAGEINLLARRIKGIQTYTRQTIEREIFEKDQYYLKVSNVFHAVKTKKAFLQQVANRRKEIQQFIKENKLSYRKNQEETMVKVIEYYNKITRLP